METWNDKGHPGSRLLGKVQGSRQKTQTMPVPRVPQSLGHSVAGYLYSVSAVNINSHATFLRDHDGTLQQTLIKLHRPV